MLNSQAVAPRVGAWIETFFIISESYLTSSHPVWVRGLKRHHQHGQRGGGGVAPRVGAWIETSCIRGCRMCPWSHPVWVRGLKPFFAYLCSKQNRCRTPCGCVD